MNINLQVVYSLKDNGSVLCFRHAINAALAGMDVETQVDDFGGEGDMRSTSCHMCLSDTFNEVFKEKKKLVEKVMTPKAKLATQSSEAVADCILESFSKK